MTELQLKEKRKRLQEAIMSEARKEWEALCKQGAKDSFLLAERLRIMKEDELRTVSGIVGWAPERVKSGLEKIQSVIVDVEYPQGRPHPWPPFNE